MKQALVVHPDFRVLGGGEFLCLNICAILQKRGYRITLATNEFRPSTVTDVYGQKWGKIMQGCRFEEVPSFKRPKHQKLLLAKRLLYSRRIHRLFNRSQRWQIMFSTQSSPLNPACPQYHFVYHANDLFSFPAFSTRPTGLGRKGILQTLVKPLNHFIPRDPTPTHFFGLSTITTTGIYERGYHNASFIFPPCEMPFKTREKKRQVVQATRITPEKRLEWFFTAAQHLPNVPFVLIGRDTPALRAYNPGYAEKLLSNIPSNVKYLEAPVRTVAYLLEESKVYLYTGDEPGMGITQMEAIGAGCLLVCPENTGGADVIDFSGIGYKFQSETKMVEAIKKALDSEIGPYTIAASAERFSIESFEKQIVDTCSL